MQETDALHFDFYGGILCKLTWCRYRGPTETLVLVNSVLDYDHSACLELPSRCAKTLVLQLWPGRKDDE